MRLPCTYPHTSSVWFSFQRRCASLQTLESSENCVCKAGCSYRHTTRPLTLEAGGRGTCIAPTAWRSRTWCTVQLVWYESVAAQEMQFSHTLRIEDTGVKTSTTGPFCCAHSNGWLAHRLALHSACVASCSFAGTRSNKGCARSEITHGRMIRNMQIMHARCTIHAQYQHDASRGRYTGARRAPHLHKYDLVL